MIERKNPAVLGSLQLQPRESGTYFCRTKERYGALYSFLMCLFVSFLQCYDPHIVFKLSMNVG